MAGAADFMVVPAPSPQQWMGPQDRKRRGLHSRRRRPGDARHLLAKAPARPGIGPAVSLAQQLRRFSIFRL
jgi:hypothetical protein